MSDREKLPILKDGTSTTLPVANEEFVEEKTSGDVTSKENQPENGQHGDRRLLVIYSAGFILVTVAVIILIPMTTKREVEIGGSVYTVQLVAMALSVVSSFTILVVYKYVTEKAVRFQPALPDVVRMFYLGFLNVSCVVLITYAGLPSRTPQYLFSILQTSAIPMTVLCKFILFRQTISRIRLICVAVVVIGIVISMIPTFLTTENKALPSEHVAGKILWPLVVAVSFMPFTLLLLYGEKLNEQDEHSWPELTFSTQLGSTFFLILVFWVDIIPWFGLSDSLPDFAQHFVRTMTSFFYAASAHAATVMCCQWLFCLAYSLQYVFLFLMLKISEGALYTQVVMGFTLPVSTLFWTLFEDDVHLIWHPHYSVQTLCIIIGLLVMVPAVICYDYFCCKEAIQAEKYKEIKPK